MERSVEVLAVILFGVLGFSHILQPKAWAEFFILLRGKGAIGAFVNWWISRDVQSYRAETYGQTVMNREVTLSEAADVAQLSRQPNASSAAGSVSTSRILPLV